MHARNCNEDEMEHVDEANLDRRDRKQVARIRRGLRRELVGLAGDHLRCHKAGESNGIVVPNEDEDGEPFIIPLEHIVQAAVVRGVRIPRSMRHLCQRS